MTTPVRRILLVALSQRLPVARAAANRGPRRGRHGSKDIAAGVGLARLARTRCT
ncbi:MAG: hypothetical protein HS109_02165 [Burkholderiales bacterium]|nr:hypothetical protein [Burkholderiales bacterium]